MDENKAFELNDDALDTIVGGTGAGASSQPPWAAAFPDGCRVYNRDGCISCRVGVERYHYGTLTSKLNSEGNWWWVYTCERCGRNSSTSSNPPEACGLSRV